MAASLFSKHLSEQVSLHAEIGEQALQPPVPIIRYLDRLGVGAALLRPDRYILAHTDSTTEIALMLQHLLPDPIPTFEPETV